MATPPPRRRGPLPTRLLERGTEEALVRALESEAVERAVIRVLESGAAERIMSSPAVEESISKALDSELLDRSWDQFLASEELQKLVERIAEAPEIRAALTSQGVGLIEDLGRGIRDVSDHGDRAIARVLQRMRGRTAAEATADAGEVRRVGLVTRALGAVLDGVLINLGFLAISAIFGVTLGGVIGDDQGPSGGAIAAAALLWSGAGALYLTTFWALAGQTPGMRFLGIRLDLNGEKRIGARRAFRRVIGTALSVLTLGIGFLLIVFDPHRRSLADRMAGTEVIESDRDTAAPHTT
jgi:uncharacterized RDD family membrane protein YckC